jgi:hypothetical protein
MPFLFVDYDQGAGGEKFSAHLSLSEQCETLEYKVFENGRTKVKDMFDQEFLKPSPRPTLKESNQNLYTIVPTHRRTALASSLLGDICSIRIQMPTDDNLFAEVKRQQISKVFLTQEPPEYFIGYLKILLDQTENKEFVKKVNYSMRTIDILLLSKGITPTDQAVNDYLENVVYKKLEEPLYDYDLIVPYEDLVYAPNNVKTQLKTVFGIDVVGTWLDDYAKTYSQT